MSDDKELSMRPIDRVRRHYFNQVDSLSHVIKVPEWDDLDIYVAPLTLGEQERINKAVSRSDLSAVIETIIIRSRDVSGKPLFDVGDRDLLRDTGDKDVMLWVVAEMSKKPGHPEDINASKKPLQPTQN